MIFINNTEEQKRYVVDSMLYIFPPHVPVEFEDITHEAIDSETKETILVSLEDAFIGIGLEKLDKAENIMKMQRILTPVGRQNNDCVLHEAPLSKCDCAA